MKTTFWQRYKYAAKNNFKNSCRVDIKRCAWILWEAFSMTIAFIAMLIMIPFMILWWPIKVVWVCGWCAYDVATTHAEDLDKLMEKKKKYQQRT